MINVPKTLCKCNSTIKKLELKIISLPENCLSTRCENNNSKELVPILKVLCPCPEPKKINLYTPNPVKIKTSKTCFESFIKNIATKKFCEIGPKCDK